MSVKEKMLKETQTIEATINQLVENGLKALDEYMKLDQAQVDHIVHQMTIAGLDGQMTLAKLAVEETGRGVYEDKIIKNLFSTEYVYNAIKNNKTVGYIAEDKQAGTYTIAEPIGVIAGVTPITNPTSTTMFKSIIATKTRNPIIFAFHPSAQKCSSAAARAVYEAAVKAGAPENCIQWVEVPSLEATKLLMSHPKIATILATGGPGMVKSAYSSGKPALGVGPGCVPAYVEKSADVQRTVNDIIMSKTFDNGMICASEQAALVDKEIYAEFKKEMADNDCYFLNADEMKKVEKVVINEATSSVNPVIVGLPAYRIAELAGVTVPKTTKILVAELKGVGPQFPLSREKLSPVLALVKVNNAEEGLTKSQEMLKMGGLGHTAVLHSKNDEVIKAFGLKLQACRLVLNAPSSHGAIGDLYNAYIPSLTLGCGSYGGNSVSSNVTTINLLNTKTMAERKDNWQWFKVPAEVWFYKHSVNYLSMYKGIERVMIVTDAFLAKVGYVDIIRQALSKRQNPVSIEVFSEVEPDPSLDTVIKGVQRMMAFKPDTIIALGGGSSMDAAKGMRLFYEHPEVDFFGIKQRFVDINKKTFTWPESGTKAKLIAIPTTSGTGSEVTAFSVITDTALDMKYPLADYQLTPDLAIIDPQFVMTVPKAITADTGMDVLTHALEAYVSALANDYTDGLALQAIKLVFEYLPRAYHDGSDEVAREKMHNASAIAGMAFTNAFLGINHSLAHKLGAEFHIPHGRANTLVMPHVIRYNASRPTKFVSFPRYEKWIANVRYAEVARMLGLPASTTEEGVESLVQAIIKMAKEFNMPLSLEECGVDKKVFEEKVEWLADRAHGDQCTGANPRYPLVAELADIYRTAYDFKA